MFAFNPFDKNFGELLVRGFAVCGAAFVGYLLGWGLAGLLNKAFFHLPKDARTWKVLKGLLRWLGAIAAAVLAALILFGSGLGLGFGGGPGTDKGEGPGQAQTTSPEPTEPPSPRVKETPPQRRDTAQVTLLAPPMVPEKRFYRLEPERTPLTLEQVEQAVLKQAQPARAGPPLTRVEILVYNNSPNDRRLTQQLVEWARRAGLTVSIVPIDQDVPP